MATTQQTIELQHLLRAAASALEAEDRALALAFSQAAPQREPRNHGLAYWVYETGLVYEIFKAWLPLAEVYWEYPYPGTSSLKADLVVLDEAGPSVVVEAKWWMNNHAKTLAVLDEDAAKLRSWSGTPRERILLCFWYSRADGWEKDLQDVRAYCARTPEPHRPELVFAERFPTHLNEVSAAFFAIAALRVK
jgi:hypothetical protein